MTARCVVADLSGEPSRTKRAAQRDWLEPAIHPMKISVLTPPEGEKERKDGHSLIRTRVEVLAELDPLGVEVGLVGDEVHGLHEELAAAEEHGEVVAG